MTEEELLTTGEQQSGMSGCSSSPIAKGTYGKIAKVYPLASGRLSFSSQRCSRCEFICFQTVDGRVFAECRADSSGELSIIILSGGYSEVIGIEGSINENFKLSIEEGSFRKLSGNKLIVSAKELNFERLNGTMEKVRFYVTNFKQCPSVEFTLGDLDISIVPVDNYSDAISYLQATRWIDITSTITVSVRGRDINRWQDISDTVQDVCLLLSLANGCDINWIYCEELSTSGLPSKAYHRNIKVIPFGTLGLLREPTGELFKAYLEASYEGLQNEHLEGAIDLRETIRYFISALNETDFTEQRALSMIITAEIIVNRFAEINGYKYIVSRSNYNSKITELGNKLLEAIEVLYPAASEDDRQKMINKLPELNRVDLKSKISFLLNSIELEVDNDELDRFVRIRNNLVHKAKFLDSNECGQTPTHQFLFVFRFVGNIILNLLGINKNLGLETFHESDLLAPHR